MKYVTVQVYEANYGKLQPIDHPANKDTREGVPMENIPADKLAKVKHGMSLTINLGDYQSAKVEVGIELPVHVDAVDNAFETAAEFSNSKLMEEVEVLYQLKKAFGSKK
jgi:hypothetical protein